MSESTTYGIIVNDEQQFDVWPAHCRRPAGWRFAGPTGTKAEMQEALRQQFIETAAAPLIAPD